MSESAHIHRVMKQLREIPVPSTEEQHEHRDALMLELSDLGAPREAIAQTAGVSTAEVHQSIKRAIREYWEMVEDGIRS